MLDLQAIRARDADEWPFASAIIADRRQYAPTLHDDGNLAAHEDRHVLLAEVERLQVALEKYGGHQMEANANGALTWLCPAMRSAPDDYYGDPGPCDAERCGLAEALAGGR
jgi:hypothetical protein